MATANVAEKPLGCRIDPADDSRRVDDVARDADALQSLLDVAADFQASGHHGSVADPSRNRVVRARRCCPGAVPCAKNSRVCWAVRALHRLSPICAVLHPTPAQQQDSSARRRRAVRARLPPGGRRPCRDVRSARGRARRRRQRPICSAITFTWRPEAIIDEAPVWRRSWNVSAGKPAARASSSRGDGNRPRGWSTAACRQRRHAALRVGQQRPGRRCDVVGLSEGFSPSCISF